MEPGQLDPRSADTSFAETLDLHMRGKNLGLTELQRRLERRGQRISLATLSYWRSGARQPLRRASLDVLTEIEDILGLPAQELRRRITARVSLVRPAEELDFADLHELSEAQSDVLRSMDLHGHLGLRELSVHHVVHVDATGSARTLDARVLYQVTRDDVVRTRAIVTLPEPLGDSATFEAVSGCSIGRIMDDPDQGVFVAEVLFGRTLRAGESVVCEYRITFPPSADSFAYYTYRLQNRTPEVLIWIVFDRSRLPELVTAYSVFDRRVPGAAGPGADDDVDSVSFETVIDVSESATAHNCAHSRGPGEVGVRWQWRDPSRTVGRRGFV